jgi:para-nitrobenzyl esterase
LAMPRARGLFHRAIIQSGAWRRFRERDDATSVASEVLRHLGVGRGELHALSHRPVEQILEAQHRTMKALIDRPQADDGSLADRHLGPVLDGTVLPYHPFSREALDNSAEIPLLIGTTRDEGTFFLSADEQLATIDESGLRARVHFLMGDKADAVIDAYRAIAPTNALGDVLIDIVTDQFVRMPAILHAELKSSLRSAPVFMYLFSYETDVLEHRLRSTHGVEIPFAFDNVDSDPLAGTDVRRYELARHVSGAWATFAKSGAPAHAKLPPWPMYEPRDRTTMILDLPSRTLNDPEHARRAAWRRF